MAHLGFKDAFARYGATLRNVQWSVSAWAPDGALVVSVWAHHYRPGPGGTAEYVDTAGRWSGPGNREFRDNVAVAFAEKRPLRLVVATTTDTALVQSGVNASKSSKDFDVRPDLVGEVAEFDGERYVFRFARVAG